MTYISQKTNLLSWIKRALPIFILATTILSSGCGNDDDNTANPVATASTNVITLRTVNLSGKNEVPSNSSTATATFSGSYDMNSNVLNYTVGYSGIIPTAMHFHKGGPGAPGPIEINLTVPTSSPNSGNVTLTASQETDLLAGNFYINIHSTAYPNGEIRAQVLTPDLEIFENIKLSGQFVVPFIASTDTGEFNGIYNKSTNLMSYYNIYYNVGSPTAFHIHRGDVGISGPVVFSLTTPLSSPTNGSSGAFTEGEEAELLAGNFYIDLTSASYPDGAIRGQLVNDNFVVFNNVKLSGAKEVPATVSGATGSFFGSYNRTTKMLSYRLYYNGITPTAFHIHQGAVGVSGPIIIPLTTPGISPSDGVTPALSISQESALLSNDYYVNLHSVAYPNGAIRGQLTQ